MVCPEGRKTIRGYRPDVLPFSGLLGLAMDYSINIQHFNIYEGLFCLPMDYFVILII